MMNDQILITELNDFIFCPISIYFHKLYGDTDRTLYQSSYQINGTDAHKTVDCKTYSSSRSIISGLDVYCEKYNLIGKIDIYDSKKHLLRERKKIIKKIYDGYIFQVYAQCFSLREMCYPVDRIELYSMDDNKTYKILLPEDDEEMLRKFEKVIIDIRMFDMKSFSQSNADKCRRCIYEPACDRSRMGE